MSGFVLQELITLLDPDQEMPLQPVNTGLFD